MKFKAIVSVLTMSAMLFSQGCASIINGTTQKVAIASQPVGATVTIDDQLYGITPVIAKLKRGSEHTVVIEVPGYEQAKFTLTKKISGWVFGNILIGGIIGFGIDAYSGGLYTLSPEQLNAELKKSQNASATVYKKDGIYIAVVLHANPTWQKVANLTPL